jgi:hypothetical protein
MTPKHLARHGGSIEVVQREDSTIIRIEYANGRPRAELVLSREQAWELAVELVRPQ